MKKFISLFVACVFLCVNAICQPTYSEFTVGNAHFRMVDVTGGTFLMGVNTDDKYESASPQHQVTLSDFAIGEFEVCQDLWIEVVGYIPQSISGENDWLTNGAGCATDLPAYYLSLAETLDFIDELNRILHDDGQLAMEDFFRLPTEAEWEFAARGGNLSKNYTYSGSNNINEVACWGQKQINMNSVGSLKPNELGLYDMSGNVEEWCSDFWQNSYENAGSLNPQGPAKPMDNAQGFVYYVMRGGSKDSRYEELCAITERSYYRGDVPQKYNDFTGKYEPWYQKQITHGARLVLQRGEKPVIEPPMFQIDVNGENGEIFGGGEFEEHTEITLTAIANKGYEFVKWSDGNTDNPRTVEVVKDETFTAIFAKIVEEPPTNVCDLQNIPQIVQNPTNTILRLQNLSINVQIAVYSVQGTQVMNFVSTNSQMNVPIQHLAVGTYVVKIGETQLSFVKN